MRNKIITLGCFVALLVTTIVMTCNMASKLDESNDRVAALEQQNNELTEQLSTNTDAYEAEIASYTDANEALNEEIKGLQEEVDELNQEIEDLSIPEEEEDDTSDSALIYGIDYVYQETTEEEVIIPDDAATYEEPEVPAPAEPEPTTEVNDEYSTVTESSYTYAGVFELTAYEWTGNTCANGNYPTTGYTVASNYFALGTVLYIEGYGTYVVEDRGGMANSVIDIYMGDYNTCIQFGRQSANVYIVE